MLPSKRAAKFEHSWMSDYKFRRNIYSRFRTIESRPQRIFYQTSLDFDNREYGFPLSMDEAWCFLIGMIFPFRDITKLFSNQLYSFEFHSLGQKIGMNGEWLRMLTLRNVRFDEFNRITMPPHNQYVAVLLDDLFSNREILHALFNF